MLRPGQVDDAVDAVQRAVRDVAHVGDDGLDPVAHGVEALLAEVHAIEQADLVAALDKLRDQDAADVAGAAGDEDRLVGVGRLLGQPVATSVHVRFNAHSVPKVAVTFAPRGDP